MPFHVKVKGPDHASQFQVSVAGATLLEHLQSHDIPIRSSCMGKGTCRQCRVQITSGVASVTENDRKFFSAAELTQGWRLSCGQRPRTNIECQFPLSFHFQEQMTLTRTPVGPWWIACDLGTTGLELAGVDKQGVWGSIKALNRQISMGADVMTRLEYAQRNGVKVLHDRIVEQITKLTKKLLSISEIHRELFQSHIFASGNSAMSSFLNQQPIETLAVAPFQPISLEGQTQKLDSISVSTLPLLSSFVGGDLTAGLFLLWSRGECDASKSWTLVDVGTNSEILCWDGTSLFVSSTPAGPAFEGSSISIGMRAEPGAIVNPRLESGRWVFEVIHQDIPKGLCGSALVQFMDHAVRAGTVKDDGEVVDPAAMKLTDTLAISQDDVREFQLAKSAIQTGIHLVEAHANVSSQCLYLAGAFGENLPLESCYRLSILPHRKTVVLGNSSLAGTVMWGQADEAKRNKFMIWVEKVKKPIELALLDEFQDAFVKNLSLGTV